MPEAWVTAAIVAKAALYLGVLGASGTAFCAVLFKLAKVTWVAAGFAGLGLVAAVLSFMLKGVALTGDASGLTDPEMLGLLWQTQSGTALMLQGGGLLVLLTGLAMGTMGWWLAGLGGLIAVASFASIGHIPDRDFGPLRVVLMLHLVTAAVWIGILIPLKQLLAQDALGAAAELGHRFARVAVIAVPVLILAGVVMGYVLVGSFAALMGSAYGQALIVKLIAVAVLLGFAAANKVRLVPALRRGELIAARHLSLSIAFEWVVVLLVLTVTAVLTSALSLPQ